MCQTLLMVVVWVLIPVVFVVDVVMRLVVVVMIVHVVMSVVMIVMRHSMVAMVLPQVAVHVVPGCSQPPGQASHTQTVKQGQLRCATPHTQRAGSPVGVMVVLRVVVAAMMLVLVVIMSTLVVAVMIYVLLLLLVVAVEGVVAGIKAIMHPVLRKKDAVGQTQQCKPSLLQRTVHGMMGTRSKSDQQNGATRSLCSRRPVFGW
jgi:hypothetical protein